MKSVLVSTSFAVLLAVISHSAFSAESQDREQSKQQPQIREQIVQESHETKDNTLVRRAYRHAGALIGEP